MSDIKSVSISEGIYKDYLTGGKHKKSHKNKIKNIKKEDQEPELKPERIVLKPIQQEQSIDHSIEHSINHNSLESEPNTTKLIKVELKNKKHLKSVKLQPKKIHTLTSKIAQTKKVRKVFIKGLQKRMKTAKKVYNNIKNMPIVQLKKYLIDNKLIKSTSKAPEAILRQIASDTQILDKTVL